MAHSLQISAIAMALMASVLCIIALATNHWIEGCAKRDGMAGFMKIFTSATDAEVTSSVDKAWSAGGFCSSRGLFNFQYYFGDFATIVGDVSGDFYSDCVTGILIGALALLAIAVGLTIYPALSNQGQVSKGCLLAIVTGCSCYLAACVLMLAGMITYTATQTSLVQNPRLYEAKSRTSSDWVDELSRFHLGLQVEVSETSKLQRTMNATEFGDTVTALMTFGYSWSFGLGWAGTALSALTCLFMLKSWFDILARKPTPSRQFDVPI